jgi:hydrogenase maturation factor HypF (carbamoyltransferase family)
MILEFKFNYFSESYILEKFLIKELDTIEIKYSLVRNGDYLFFYIQYEDGDKLKDIIDELFSQLPISIYLGEYSVNVVDSMKENNCIIPETNISLPYCPKCLALVSDKNSNDYYNIFKNCDLCGYDLNDQVLYLDSDATSDYKSVISKVAELLSNNEIIKIKTFNGYYNISNKSLENSEIMCYDLDTVLNYTRCDDTEKIALASIEKPSIKLQTNLKFKCDYEESNIENGYFRLPNDLILHFLFQELLNYDIKLLFISNETINYDHILYYDQNIEEKENIKIIKTKNDMIVLNSYCNDTLAKKISNLTDYEIPFLVSKEFKVLDEFAVAALYLTKDSDSKLIFHSKKIGFIERLNLTYTLDTVETLLNDVSSQDEIAAKLIIKYKEKYQELYLKIKDNKIGKVNIYQFWQVLADILGIDSVDIKSELFLGKSGPRVDYKLIQNDNKDTILDSLKMVQSVISFKLAGSDDMNLSYGIIESFVDFVTRFIDDMKLDMNVEIVTLNGNMLYNSALFKHLAKSISKNHRLLLNKNIPIDRI